jgi:hypothetical protein
MRRDVRRQILRALRQVPLPSATGGDRQTVAGVVVMGPQLFDLDSQVGLAVQLPDGRRHAWRSAMWEYTSDFTVSPIRRLQTTQDAVEEAQAAMVEWVGQRLG